MNNGFRPTDLVGIQVRPSKLWTLSLSWVLFVAGIGVAPTLVLDSFNIARSVPREQIVKAFTLKSTNLDVTYRIVLKQVLQQILNSVRLNLKPLPCSCLPGG